VQIDVYDDYMPVFGLIRYVIKVDESFQIYCQVLDTKRFNEHYYAYEVDVLEYFTFKKIEDLNFDKISSVCTNAHANKMVVWK
jgi:hypothetical protein